MLNISDYLINIDNCSELELIVMLDMIDQGLDFNSKEDIEKFWKERLQ